MGRKIICAWESPTNEGTAVFTIGDHPTGYYPGTGGDDDWTVGRIEMLTLSFFTGTTSEAFKRFMNSRVDIYDDNDKLRVSLPTSGVAVEYAEDE